MILRNVPWQTTLRIMRSIWFIVSRGMLWPLYESFSGQVIVERCDTAVLPLDGRVTAGSHELPPHARACCIAVRIPRISLGASLLIEWRNRAEGPLPSACQTRLCGIARRLTEPIVHEEFSCSSYCAIAAPSKLAASPHVLPSAHNFQRRPLRVQNPVDIAFSPQSLLQICRDAVPLLLSLPEYLLSAVRRNYARSAGNRGYRKRQRPPSRFLPLHNFPHRGLPSPPQKGLTVSGLRLPLAPLFVKPD
jgi:hypothetical protein